MKQFLLILFVVLGSVAIAGNKIPKKLRKSYTGFIPAYSLEIDQTIVLVDKTFINIKLKETHALVQFGDIKYHLKIENLKKVKSVYTFSFIFPEDTKIGKLNFNLNKKTKTIIIEGPGVIPDGELR